MLKQIERDLQIDEAKRRAYSEAVWASDVEKNKINLMKSKASVETQTGTQTGATTTETQTEPDIGDPSDSLSDIGDNEIDVDAEIEQLRSIESQENTQKASYNFLINLFKNNPEYAQRSIRLINAETGRLHDFAILGKDGTIRHVKTNRKMNVDPDTIDWVASEAYIISILQLTERNDYARRKNMMNKAFETLRDNAKYSKTIRQMEERDREANERSLMQQEHFDAPPYAVGQSVDLETESEQYILNLFAMKPEEMKRLYDYIHPVSIVDETNVSSRAKINILTDYYLQPSDNRVKIVKRLSQYDNPSIRPKVNWGRTLEFILNRARDMGIDLDIENLDQVYITPRKRAQSKSPEMPRNRKTVRNSKGTETISREQAKSFIKQIYQAIPGSEMGRFNPTVNSREGKRVSPNYYFAWDFDIDAEGTPEVGSLSLMRTKTGSKLSGNEKSKVMSSIDWITTYDRLLDHIYQIYRQTSDAQLAQMLDNLVKRIKLQIKEPSVDVDQVDVDTFIDNLDRADIKRTMDDMLTKLEGKGTRLRGRGLQGAGRVYNLRDIEGSGIASDLKYKRLGSKFIRVADLHANKLKLVYPNRTQVGKIRTISPTLSKLINELLFQHDINQQIYNDLPIADKRLFHEILRLTHLQHQFSTPLADPMETLQAEFDKLRSQVIGLGNNNPDAVRELKALSVDLYSQKLISEDDFKQIILL